MIYGHISKSQLVYFADIIVV